MLCFPLPRLLPLRFLVTTRHSLPLSSHCTGVCAPMARCCTMLSHVTSTCWHNQIGSRCLSPALVRPSRSALPQPPPHAIRCCCVTLTHRCQIRCQTARPPNVAGLPTSYVPQQKSGALGPQHAQQRAVPVVPRWRRISKLPGLRTSATSAHEESRCVWRTARMHPHSILRTRECHLSPGGRSTASTRGAPCQRHIRPEMED